MKLVAHGNTVNDRWLGVCPDNQSWVKITFSEHLRFSGIGLKTAADRPEHDPKRAQFYIATPENEWKFIGAITFKEAYKRLVTIMTYTGAYRTHAILILLENPGDQTIHLNEVILYNEVPETRVSRGEIKEPMPQIRTLIETKTSEDLTLDELKFSQLLAGQDSLYAIEHFSQQLDK